MRFFCTKRYPPLLLLFSSSPLSALPPPLLFSSAHPLLFSSAPVPSTPPAPSSSPAKGKKEPQVSNAFPTVSTSGRKKTNVQIKNIAQNICRRRIRGSVAYPLHRLLVDRRSPTTALGAVLSGNTADLIGFSNGPPCHGGVMLPHHGTSSFAHRYLLPSSTVHSAGG